MFYQATQEQAQWVIQNKRFTHKLIELILS